MATYLVCSPERMREFNDYDEPPEPFCYVAEVEASTKREAIIAAVKTLDFAGWRVECKGDGRPPWAGLKATFICKENPRDD